MRGSLGLKKNLILALLLAAGLALPARAAEITVLQSAALPAYNSALQGFSEVISRDIPSRGQKAIQAHAITTHILTEATGTVQLRQMISDDRPGLLVAIGSSSLALVKDIPDLPILYLMVPFPEAMGKNPGNITGISMGISAAQQLEALTLAAPTVKNIGLVYDPERSGALVAEARDYASRNHLNLTALPVRATDEVPGRLADLKGKIDWLWMVPDLTVLTPQTVDYIMLFSLENQVPVLTFADKYLEMGAVLAVTFDPLEMGRQAGAMALDILHQGKGANIPPARVEKVRVHANARAAEMLGVALQQGAEGRP
ncbi:MAG: ABC transporter substrate-binding protein [Desulfobulbaceae bacterium]